MGFGNIKFGTLAAILQISGAVANLPAGFIADLAKHQWGLVLTSCMVLAAVGYGLMAASPVYGFLAIVLVLLDLPGTVWHMPAIAAISQRLPERRGFGLSVHGVGGQAGDSIGPLIAGGLLTFMAWRVVALVYVVPALLMTAVVWWSLRGLGTSEDTPAEQTPLKVRIRDAGRLLRNPVILGLMLVSTLRDMGASSLVLWVPKYLKDPVAEGGLEMSAFMVGLHLALLFALGMVSSPIVGVLSDRLGRKTVLLPCLTAVGLLSLGIGQVGGGISLILIVLAIGLFSSSMNQILQATILDQIGPGTEGATMGLVMTANSGVSALAPIFAALVVNAYGLGAVFIYTATLWVACLPVLLLTPLKSPQASA